MEGGRKEGQGEMALVETDVILALISQTDKHHHEAVKLIKQVKPLRLSPYALIELDLLIQAGKLEAKTVELYKALNEALTYHGVEVIKPTPIHLAKAWQLREKYQLTYFDSLHASTAIVEGEALISYDKAYLEVKELRYLHPHDALTTNSPANPK